MKNERLLSLRNQMKEAGVHCMVIPTSDYHNSEYVSDFFMARKYFSGFTGSAGTLVVTPDEAALFTDGRYFIQVFTVIAPLKRNVINSCAYNAEKCSPNENVGRSVKAHLPLPRAAAAVQHGKTETESND